MQKLRLSPGSELVAGLTRLYPIPGSRSGSFSLIKIWSVKTKQLVHDLRVPGRAYELVFSPDESTVVAADRTGNLGSTTTIRAWNLADGSERRLGFFFGETDKLYFSPDGSRLAAIANLDYSFLNAFGDFSFKLGVWQVTGEGDAMTITIPNAFGDSKATCLPLEKWSNELRQEVVGGVTPVLRGFSADGKQIICETESGLRTTYNARSGELLQHPNICTVGVFKSMLMVALNQLRPDMKVLNVVIEPGNKQTRLERSADGWWRAGTVKTSGFKIDVEHFVSRVRGSDHRDHIMMRLGLKDGTNLADLSSLKHPLGVIKIDRKKGGLKFRLEEVTDGIESGETLQSGEVRWASPPGG